MRPTPPRVTSSSNSSGAVFCIDAEVQLWLTHTRHTHCGDHPGQRGSDGDKPGTTRCRVPPTGRGRDPCLLRRQTAPSAHSPQSAQSASATSGPTLTCSVGRRLARFAISRRTLLLLEHLLTPVWGQFSRLGLVASETEARAAPAATSLITSRRTRAAYRRQWAQKQVT